MKNCLTVLGILIGCFLVACFLMFAINMNFGHGFKRGPFLGQWRDFDSGPMRGLSVSIDPDRIDVFVPRIGQAKRITEKGHWTAHAFYVDSHLDAPAEIAVATQQRNGDLVVDVGHFVPEHPGQITMVMFERGNVDFDPYPVHKPGETVTYPPPRGLIQPGMLEWDLQMLPWRADHVEITPDDNGGQSTVYTYHSDRAELQPLLVTVVRGKVVRVYGGAEDSADIPYQFPKRPDDNTSSDDSNSNKSWAVWFFDLIFRK